MLFHVEFKIFAHLLVVSVVIVVGGIVYTPTGLARVPPFCPPGRNEKE